jgi:small nuclear ribonucleoprotein (snRNP)-like protein
MMPGTSGTYALPHANGQLVELKNGVTFNGHLVECDNFMNVTLREVYQTSADGERFWKMKEMFIKGNIVSLVVLVFAWHCAPAAPACSYTCSSLRVLRVSHSVDRTPTHPTPSSTLKQTHTSWDPVLTPDQIL